MLCCYTYHTPSAKNCKSDWEVLYVHAEMDGRVHSETGPAGLASNQITNACNSISRRLDSLCVCVCFGKFDGEEVDSHIQWNGATEHNKHTSSRGWYDVISLSVQFSSWIWKDTTCKERWCDVIWDSVFTCEGLFEKQEIESSGSILIWLLQPATTTRRLFLVLVK